MRVLMDDRVGLINTYTQYRSSAPHENSVCLFVSPYYNIRITAEAFLCSLQKQLLYCSYLLARMILEEVLVHR